MSAASIPRVSISAPSPDEVAAHARSAVLADAKAEYDQAVTAELENERAFNNASAAALRFQPDIAPADAVFALAEQKYEAQVTKRRAANVAVMDKIEAIEADENAEQTATAAYQEALNAWVDQDALLDPADQKRQQSVQAAIVALSTLNATIVEHDRIKASILKRPNKVHVAAQKQLKILARARDEQDAAATEAVRIRDRDNAAFVELENSLQPYLDAVSETGKALAAIQEPAARTALQQKIAQDKIALQALEDTKRQEVAALAAEEIEFNAAKAARDAVHKRHHDAVKERDEAETKREALANAVAATQAAYKAAQQRAEREKFLIDEASKLDILNQISDEAKANMGKADNFRENEIVGLINILKRELDRPGTNWKGNFNFHVSDEADQIVIDNAPSDGSPARTPKKIVINPRVLHLHGKMDDKTIQAALIAANAMWGDRGGLQIKLLNPLLKSRVLANAEHLHALGKIKAYKTRTIFGEIGEGFDKARFNVTAPRHTWRLGVVSYYKYRSQRIRNGLESNPGLGTAYLDLENRVLDIFRRNKRASAPGLAPA